MPCFTRNPVRRAFALLFPALLPLPAFRSDDPAWAEVLLNDALAVRFPGRPSFLSVQNMPLYGLRTGEAIYTATRADGMTLTRRSRVVLLGDIVYALTVTSVTAPTDGSRRTENAFLASLRTKEKE